MKAPTEKQIAVLEEYGYPIPESRFEASAIITKIFADHARYWPRQRAADFQSKLQSTCISQADSPFSRHFSMEKMNTIISGLDESSPGWDAPMVDYLRREGGGLEDYETIERILLQLAFDHVIPAARRLYPTYVRRNWRPADTRRRGSDGPPPDWLTSKWFLNFVLPVAIGLTLLAIILAMAWP